MNIKRQTIFVLFLIIVLSVVIVLATALFNKTIATRMENSVMASLSETTDQQQHIHNDEIAKEFSNLANVSSTIQVLYGNSEKTERYFQYLTTCFGYETLVAASPGAGVTSQTEYINAENTEGYKNALNGEMTISAPYESSYTGNRVMALSVPIYSDGRSVGALIGEYPVEFFDNLFVHAFENRAYGFIIDDEGEIINMSPNSYNVAGGNVFDLLGGAIYTDGLSGEKVINSIINDESDDITYELGNGDRMASYRPINYNGWSVLIVIPTELVLKQATLVSEQLISFNITIISALTILSLAVLTMRHFSIRKIQKIAYFDELTGLPNLEKFKQNMYKMLKKYPDKEFAIVKIDVADFKSINEVFDFETGNDMIRAIADTTRELACAFFLHGKVGTDEFLLFSSVENMEKFVEIREEKELDFKKKVPALHHFNVKLRYGRYNIEKHEVDVNAIIDKVTLVHSLLRNQKDKIIAVYDESLRRNVIKMSEITNKMEKALENREYKLYLQPKYQIDTGKICGAEALVRWIEDDGSMIYPNDFIPVFEQNSFILKLDFYMLERVCEHLRNWINNGEELITISVNFSRMHLSNPNFTSEIKAVTEKYGVPEKFVEIELTESAITENENELIRVLKELHDYGFTLSMDDFGNGYSSLGLLKNLEVDIIKMDRNFFTYDKDPERTKIVIESVIDMAHSLGIKTVAEGIETAEQMEFLKSLDCAVGQGYFYARPMPYDEFNSFRKKQEES